MKRTVALILALVLCLSLCACGGKNNLQAAFDDSAKAFNYVTDAYIATNEFSQDVYEAWFQGVNNRTDYDNESELTDFADEMHIELVHIQQAVANLYGKETYNYNDKAWENLRFLYNNSYFSAWISVISEAYKCSGKAAAISDDLEAAKNLMKQLSDQYADYEHYPTLKKYFTNTLAFFDFCCNPEGSFEQVKETFNSYRNNAREYFFDLNYVFCDSIGGISDYTNEDETEETTEATATIG